ncbi:PAS domain-containing sensor histidine kinase [Sutcliffiella horikoshii]|uniref:PAS domain-containing sensor histidine kinase n=1 Tax=Sutcliffiella horikoshii TaxID=79883 RepID=UPI00203F353A|nr:PAS domain-containing sensor histidine kinase [Sutcliffiella horikoshii]MCM3619047.1 PAS domain-containing sensor histidine kinase [Sutcliffiella horikoshii]
MKRIGINSLSTLKTESEITQADTSKGYILFDSDLKVFSMDEGAREMLGLTNQTVTGCFLPNLLKKDAYKILLNCIYSVIQEDLFVQEDIKVSEHPVQWYNMIIHPIGKNSYSLLLVDINQQKKLIETKRKLQDIFEGSHVGIIIIDNKGKIIELNPAAGCIFGVKSEKLNGENINNFVSKTNEVPLKEHWIHLLKYGKAKDNEYIIIRPDKSKRIISFSASKNIYEGHHLIIFHDLTLQKNIQDSLIIERNEAERASKTKTNFLAMIGHELRTPLNSIIGYSQVLEEDKREPLTDKQKTRLAKILSSSRHLMQLINNILELIRIDTKTETINANIKTVRIKSAISESLQAVKSNADDSDISLHIEKDVEDISINIDPIRLQQVLVNLLNNAIKYNKNKGTVTLYWRVDGRYLAIFVKDTGLGIPFEHQENIFEPFYRINHPSYNIEGTGIGLTLVKQNVLEMKGTVGVSSIEGTGSTFWIKVPI